MYTSVEEIPRIVANLHATFDTELTKDKEFRRTQLENFRRFFKEQEKELCDVVYKDLRKHPLETITGEIGPVCGDIEYMLKNLNRLVKPTSVKAQYLVNAMDKLSIRKDPKGVVLIIGSWNYPVHLLLLPLAGAIAAGNCAVIKPSESAIHTAEFIANVLPKYLDKRAYTVVQGAVKETTVVLDQPFDHIFYTGSGNVGKVVMAAAAKTLTPITLELGGKCPAVVAPDADLKVAASRIIWGKYYNCGQTCVAPDYVLITKDRFKPFVEECRKVVKERFGEDTQKSNSYGRLINERRFDTMERLVGELDESKILIGGNKDKSDLFFSPTVVGPLTPNEGDLMSEEIFGPILPIVPVNDMEEAIRVIKSKETPLSLYVFTDNGATREKILNKTRSGGILVNDVLMHVQELGMPFGGCGPSGMGSYHGQKSFDTFTHERSTMVKNSGLDSVMQIRYPPYDSHKQDIMVAFTMGLPGSLAQKIKSSVNLVSSFKTVFFQKKAKM